MRRKFIYDKEARRVVEVPVNTVLPRRSQGLHVINDTMDAVKSMTDGKHYDSKSALRREYKARGVEEIGNERVRKEAYEPASAGADIMRALQEHGHT